MILIVFACFFLYTSVANGFVRSTRLKPGGKQSFWEISTCHTQTKNLLNPFSITLKSKADGKSEEGLRAEAEELLLRARRLRLEIGSDIESEKVAVDTSANPFPSQVASPWSVSSDHTGEEYRLYVDIGREEGTWMDRRWGASGRRIQFSIDVKFLTFLADESVASKMVKDNFGGSSSEFYSLESASSARLRNGFDKMECHGGGYRIDSSRGQDTIRFYLAVDGTTTEQNSSYG
jgi:hypothetical protein